ncbi:Repeat domain-containing protein [Cyclobacterium lianum]|uniref:Repeat domain-containing protein n=1 Tax=Cyclobacterium lianum TaxID=388280 RepID=A0A1M7I1J0_9BACT|nr:VCBS repeat-containing protein [Cyclobacterium lianum]SHM34671.1 Repeat domain-containing protein [Cyclobacterium lianum]
MFSPKYSIYIISAPGPYFRFAAIYLLLLMHLLGGCGRDNRQEEKIGAGGSQYSAPVQENGETLKQPADILAKSYCTGCHLYPDPGMLDRSTWETILPRMGHYYGIYPDDTTRNWLIEGGRAGQIVNRQNIFPEMPVIDSLIFNKISAYFLREAPAMLSIPEKEKIQIGMPGFSLRKPESPTKNPMTLMVHISGPDRFYISDVGRSVLAIMNNSFEVQQMSPSPEGTVWIHEGDRYDYALVIGTFNPTDMDLGFVMRLPDAPGQPAAILARNLQRPVHMDRGDLDGDGLEDMVICEYGKQTGSLAWWKQDQNGAYQKQILLQQPGATKAYIRDMDNDGRKDIIALFGQGDEGIFFFRNQGNGKFISERLLRFPPTYGSSYFELFDFNGDGHPDIIYTNGDNADYDPIAKPYHGIRIYINDGNNRFSEEFFYPLNGAYKAVPADFDQDGDVDIAAIAFFPDYENAPEKSFIYLENNGAFDFEVSSFEGASDGRWMAMDVGDMDGDGDLDILLGSMVFGTDYTDYFEKWVEGSLPFLWLENRLR